MHGTHNFKIPSMCLPAHILVTHYILKTWPSLKCDYYSEEEGVLFCAYMHSYISGCPVFNEHTRSRFISEVKRRWLHEICQVLALRECYLIMAYPDQCVCACRHAVTIFRPWHAQFRRPLLWNTNRSRKQKKRGNRRRWCNHSLFGKSLMRQFSLGICIACQRTKMYHITITWIRNHYVCY